jgi:hypothetical protein
MVRSKTPFLFDLDGTDLFLTAAERLGVGLLSGGYGEDELSRAGALRVYADPADLLDHIDEIAARS